MSKLKFGFFSLLVAFFTVHLSGQAVFADEKGSSSEVVYNDGTFGLSHSGAGSVSGQGKVAKPLLAETPILNLHTAYTSYTDKYGGDSYWAFLCSDDVFIFGSFSTLQGTLTGVRVRWKIVNKDVPKISKTFDLSHDFSEIVVTPDDFWDVWLHIHGLVPGHYEATVTVQSLENYGKKSAKCRFNVIPCDVQ